MAVVDVSHHTLTLKIVYYGCALGGKTTNLITLHRLTDPNGKQGLVSIATRNDRTLFFDLLPVALGRIGNLEVRVKVYTVPGQPHYELTRRQVLSGADGVVMVADSADEAQDSNRWAIQNLKMNLRENKLDPATVPVIFQWNKRDLPSAVPVERMEAVLNPERKRAFAAVATTGVGVVDTFAAILVESVVASYAKSGKSTEREEIGRAVAAALADAAARQPSLASDPAGETAMFEHRMDTDRYHEEWAERGRDRQIVDQETLLREAVQTNMELAERLEDLHGERSAGGRAGKVLRVLSDLAATLSDPGAPALPPRFVAPLLEALGRTRGSLLLARAGAKTMEEAEVFPRKPDPLNATNVESLGSVAWRLATAGAPRHVEDVAGELFFGDVPPCATGVASVFVSPILCDGVGFGALVLYAALNEPPIGADERDAFTAASRVLALSLHWRALRRKVAKGGAEAAESSPASSGR